MNHDERFDELWNDYLEGELDQAGMAELQQLLDSNADMLEAATDSFRVHRLLGLDAADSVSRHEDFVQATMAKLPAGRHEFVGDVMSQLTGQSGRTTQRSLRKPTRGMLILSSVVAGMLLLCAVLFVKNSSASGVARITGLHGAVQWTGAGGVVREVTDIGHVLNGGTLETLSADAWTNLQFHDGTTLTVSGPSLLTLSDREQKRIQLRHGCLSAKVKRQPSGRPMLVRTASAELSVLGTRFDVEAATESTRLTVHEGRVRLKRLNDAEQVDVPARQTVMASLDDLQDLSPVKRTAPVTVWRSDLRSDAVVGKWISDLVMTGKKLKIAVRNGELSVDAARVAFKEAARFDDTTGSVWATPSAVGSLVVLSPQHSVQQPLLLNADSRIRVRGQLHPRSTLEIGLSVGHADGGFAGKYSTQIAANEISSNGRFDLDLSLSRFRSETNPAGSLVGTELTSWWCVAESTAVKVEITGVEVTD